MKTKKEDRLLMKIVTILADYKFNSTQTETGEMIAERIINIVKEQDREIKLSNCIICGVNTADMCGECMLKSQLEVGNKRYDQALKDFIECIDIDLLFTDLVNLKTKEKVKIPKEIQEFLNEYNKYIIQRLEQIAKELGAKDGKII